MGGLDRAAGKLTHAWWGEAAAARARQARREDPRGQFWWARGLWSLAGLWSEGPQNLGVTHRTERRADSLKTTKKGEHLVRGAESGNHGEGS